MAITTGATGRMGVAKETTYGGLTAPAELVHLNSESIDRVIEMAEKDHLISTKAGYAPPDQKFIKVVGGLQAEANYQTNDLLWALAMGGACSIAGGTAPYTHKILLTDLPSRSLSACIEKTQNVWNLEGLVIDKFNFTLSPSNSPGVIDMDTIVEDLTRNTTHRAALAALSDPGTPRIMFSHTAKLWLGDLTDALVTGDVQDISEFKLTLDNHFTPDHRTFPTTQFIKQPARNGKKEVFVELTYPRMETETLHAWMDAQTYLQMSFTCGITISTVAYSFLIELPTLVLESVSSQYAGPEIVPIKAKFRACRNTGNTFLTGTEEFNIETHNSRAAIIWA
jgi:hypothetical protein